MGKKKTLKQKKLHDVRVQKTTSQEVSSPTSSLHTISYSFSPLTKQSAPSVVQQTVMTDVRKTAFICLSIVLVEVILFSLLQNHVLALPFVRY